MSDGRHVTLAELARDSVAVLKAPHPLSDEQAARLRRTWERAMASGTSPLIILAPGYELSLLVRADALANAAYSARFGDCG